MRRLIVLLLLLLAAVPAWAAPPAPLGEDGWRALLRDHAGRPVVVHFWGVTCGPCQVELPEWSALLRERPDLPLVLVEVDPMPVGAERVGAMLAKAGLAAADSWALEDSSDRLRFAIDPDWAGELPMTLLIDGRGKVTRMVGMVDMTAIRRWHP